MKMFKLKPYCAKAIWGGNNLRKKYGKISEENIAEAWELSGYPGKESVIVGGEFDGKTITELISVLGQRALGTKAESYDKFPLLIKLIDAAAPLSIQVHPNDEIAKKLGADGGKTEMWIICDCENDAFIYYGMKEVLSAEAFEKAILDGSITEHLNKVYVKPGDTFFIKAGTVHAIGAGITICEIQQTSDTTYRLFDYKRKDANGNERELHIEKGIIATDQTPPEGFYEEGIRRGDETVLVSCPYFTVSRLEINGEASVTVGKESFSAFTVTNGEGKLHSVGDEITLKKGETVFIPADSGNLKICGNMTVVRSQL